MKTKPITGTREWATSSINILRGCSHNCRYCYARQMALRFGRIKSADEWARPVVRYGEVHKPRQPVEGTIMFPSIHDILPEFLQPCLEVIGNILAAGNRLLIITKPHIECIEAICREFPSYKEKILFRFTIGAIDKSILDYWEPGAPGLSERLDCLQTAYYDDYATSVSIEPILDSEHVVRLFWIVESYVTDTIWIGKMNRIGQRVVPGTDPAEIERIKAGQTDERIRQIYDYLEDQPKVRWKNSIKRVVGLEPPAKAGLDE